MIETARVYLVDDDAAVRDSLRWLLESEGLQVECFPSAADFLQRLDHHLCGCVMLDVRMPGMSGLELLAIMQAQQYVLPVIIITGHGDVPMAVRAIKAGACDFLQKPFNDDMVIERVKAAVQSNLNQQPHQVKTEQLIERYSSLTPRQQQIMQMVVNGDANKMIAYRLDISMKTVEAHRAQVMRKMEAKTLSKLVMFAQQLGLSE